MPRESEQNGFQDKDEAYTFKRPKKDMPSSELEEVLMGITLKFAKETFQARDRESGEDEGSGKDDGSGAEEAGENRVSDAALSSNTEDIATSGDEKRRGAPKSAPILLRPVVSTDDEKSHKIMRPSIRHTLSRLDDVLMALHHARKTCHQYTLHQTDEEATDWAPRDEADVEVPDPQKARGRPRKNYEVLEGESQKEHLIRVARLRKKSISSLLLLPDDDSPQTDQAMTPHRLTKKRGRPQKNYEVLEGESHREHVARIARIQKKPMPALPLAARSINARGLRDWSEVLGSAALVGLPPDVIARATQRCSNLFGEEMTMINTVEAAASNKEADIIVRYQPEEIPELGTESEDFEMSEDGVSSDGPEQAPTNRTRSTSTGGSRTREDGRDAFPCPIPNCTNNGQRGFGLMYVLRRHLRIVHSLNEGEIDGLFVASDAEMDGAVHLDRFLKPITRKAGWRGRDKGDASKAVRSKATRSRSLSRAATEASEHGSAMDTSSSESAFIDSGDSMAPRAEPGIERRGSRMASTPVKGEEGEDAAAAKASSPSSGAEDGKYLDEDIYV